jgi:hypothetical protein
LKNVVCLFGCCKSIVSLEWDGIWMGMGMGMGMGTAGIDCTMRILDGWKQIARLFVWEVGVNGVVVGDLGLVCVVLVLVLALALAVLLDWFFLSIRRGDSGIGLDFSCTYTRMRSLALCSFERY